MMARRVSFTQFVKVDDHTAIALYTHILPKDEGKGIASYSWWSDRHNQELMVLVHQTVCSKATSCLTGSDGGSPPTGPHYEFRRGENLRALLTFKPHDYREHVVLPTQQLTGLFSPCVVFVNEYGRRVIPFLNSITTEGRGYRAFRLLPEAVHAFVDPHELPSALGIFKVLAQLDPTYTCSPDIVSYFQPHPGCSKEQGCGEQSEREEEAREEGMLAQVPVAGLKKSLSRRGRKKRPAEKPPNQRYTKRLMRASARETPGHAQQLTIAESIASAQTRPRSTEASLGREETNVAGSLEEERLPSELLDEFFDFSSQQTGSCPTLSGGGEGMTKEKGKGRLLSSVTASPRPQGGQKVSGREQRLSSSSAHEAHRVPPLHDAPDDPPILSPKMCGNSPPINELTQSLVEGFDDYFGGGSSPSVGSRGSLSPQPMAESATEWKLNQSSEDLFAEDHTEQGRNGERRKSDDECSVEGRGPTEELSVTQDDIDLALFDIQTPDLASRRPWHVPVLTDLTNTPPGSQTRSQDHDMKTASTEAAPQVYNSPADCSSSSASGVQILPGREEADGGLTSSVTTSTVENNVIMISSEEEEEEEGCGSKPQVHEKGKKHPQRTKKLNLKQLFQGKHYIKEVPREHVQKWLRSQRDVIVSLFVGNTYSRRHEDFKDGAKKKAALRHQMHTGLFRKDQLEVITRGLLRMFCAKNMKFFDYAMSVLYPECLIRFIMDFYRVDFEEAEQIMFAGGEDPDQVEVS